MKPKNQKIIAVITLFLVFIAFLPASADGIISGKTNTYTFDTNDISATALEVVAHVDGILSQIIKPNMNNDQKVKAVYDFLLFQYIHEDEQPYDKSPKINYTPKVLTNIEATKINSAIMPISVLCAHILLKNGEGVCDDFSALFGFMLNRMGIPCEVWGGYYVRNDGSRSGHAWNRACVDDVWYWYDPDVEGTVYRRGGSVLYYLYKKDDNYWKSNHADWKLTTSANDFINFYGGPSSSFNGGSTYTQGSGSGIIYIVQKDFSQFSNVKVNNATLVQDKDYKAENSSTKITLYPAYLNTLSAGEYTLTVGFKDGTNATAKFRIAESKEQRIAGNNRIETAIAVSKKGWEKADTVVLAYAYSFADALSATPLAYKENAPILLTDNKTLSSATLTEIQRLKPSKIILVGGTGVLSAEIENTLKQTYQVTRYAGENRYETASQIAKAMETTDKAVIVNGEVFPDALAISSYVANQGIPILFTLKDSVPDVTANILSSLNIKTTIVIGGKGVVSDEVLGKLPNPTRHAGENRFETAAAVANAKELNMNLENVYIVTGTDFADALVAGNLASRTLSPLIMTGAGNNLPTATENFFKTNKAKIKDIIIVGGAGAVPESQVNAIRNILE